MQEIARPADGGKLPQVMNDEEGLRGCWFAGSIAQLCASHALVSYADLEDEANGGPLQEWFLLPGVSTGQLSASAAGGKRVHVEPGYMLRPTPPAEVPWPTSCASRIVHEPDAGPWLCSFIKLSAPSVLLAG